MAGLERQDRPAQVFPPPPGAATVQVLTNERFVKSRGRLGHIATLLGFATLIVGLYLTWQQPEMALYAYVTLVPGFLLISYGNYTTIRWGTHPRVDEALGIALKSLDNKYQLFNYVKGLPTDNLLLTPSGLVVIEVRPYFGAFENKGGRWKRKRNLSGWLLMLGEGGLGNPSRDIQHGVKTVTDFLTTSLGGEDAAQIPVEGVVVFTHPRAVLTVDNPEVPVVAVKDLKPEVRRLRAQGRLNTDLYRRLARVLHGTLGETGARSGSGSERAGRVTS